MAATAKNIIAGLILITLLTTGLVITLSSGGIRTSVEKSSSTFSIYQNGKWLVSGVEYNFLYNKTTNLKINTNNVTITYNTTSNNITYVYRYTPFVKGPIILDTYVFDGRSSDVKLFPVYHKVEVLNGSGYDYQYEVRKLDYSGISRTGLSSPMSFGKKMRVEWQSGAFFSSITKGTTSTLKIKYHVTNNDQTFNVRLFDPSAAPNISSVFILPINIKSNETAWGWCGITDTDSSVEIVNYIFYVNGTSKVTGTINVTVGNYSNYTLSPNINKSFGYTNNNYVLQYTWYPNYTNNYVNYVNHTLFAPANSWAFVYYKAYYSDGTSSIIEQHNIYSTSQSFSDTNPYTTKPVTKIEMWGYTDSYASLGWDKITSVYYQVLYDELNSKSNSSNVVGIRIASMATGNYTYNATIIFSCKVNDTVNTVGYTNSSSYLVYPSTPYMSSVTITPTSPNDNNDIISNCTADSSGTIERNWYRNGTLYGPRVPSGIHLNVTMATDGTDYGPNSYNATVSGATHIIDCGSGIGCYRFNGTALDYLQFSPYSITNTAAGTKTTDTNRSFSIWVKPSGLTSGAIYYDNNDVPPGWFYLYYENVTSNFTMAFCDAESCATRNITLAKNTWHQLGWTYNADTDMFIRYVDGVYLNNVSATYYSTLVTVTRIGVQNYHDTADLGFDGDMKLLKVYNKVLTASDFAALYADENLPSTVSYLNTTVGDTWITSCRVYNSTGAYSSWMNSTPTLITVVYSSTNNITQNGLVSNRTYEYDTTINLTVVSNGSIVDVIVITPLNTTDLPINFTGTFANYSFLIPAVNIITSTGNLTNMSWGVSSWYNITGLRFSMNITGTNLTDINIYVNGVYNKMLKGTISNGMLNIYSLSDGNVTKSLFFTSTSLSQTYYLNVPTQPFINLSITLSSYPADPLPFNFTEMFINSTNESIDSGNTTASHPYFYTDDLTSNTGEWGAGGTLDTNAYNPSLKYYELISHVGGVSCSTYGCETVDEESGYVISTQIDWSSYDVVGFDVYMLSVSFSGYQNGYYGSGEVFSYFEATGDTYDGDPSTIFRTYEEGAAHGYCDNYVDGVWLGHDWTCGGLGYDGELWFKRTAPGSTTWNYYEGNTYIKQVTIPSGSQYFKMRAVLSATSYLNRGSGTADFSGKIRKIYLGGAGGNHTGDQQYATTFNVTSTKVFTASKNITAAYLSASTYGGGIIFYLSSDNGTTWEQTDNPSYHLFTAKNTSLKWRAVGTQATNTSNFGVTEVSLTISTSNPSNFTMDIGNDAFIEYAPSGTFNYSVNSTITSQYSINNYIKNYCSGLDACLVPLTFTSATIGGATISNITARFGLNPISLNNTVFPKTGSLTMNVSGGTIATTNYSNGELFIVGDVDNVPITIIRNYVNGSSDTTSMLASVRYSPYNITQVRPTLDFYPTSA